MLVRFTREQILVYMQPGALPANALADVIKQVEELDMDDVRAKIAEQELREAI